MVLSTDPERWPKCRLEGDARGHGAQTEKCGRLPKQGTVTGNREDAKHKGMRNAQSDGNIVRLTEIHLLRGEAA